MIDRIKSDVVIVGGGPAGMTAANSILSAQTVTIIDDNPLPGGQIWRAETGTVPREVAIHSDRLKRRNVRILSGTQVFAADGKWLLCESSNGVVRVNFEKLIIAAGARELFLPFPGWTLPNVFGAGGLQALVKGGFDVSGKRVVVAGTGPLLLAVASYLRSKGARVALIAEQAPRSNVMRFGLGLIGSPMKIAQAIGLGWKLKGIRMAYGSYVERADGDGVLRMVSVRTSNGSELIDCDLLACGFHLVPNTELAGLLGCHLDGTGAVVVDETQLTSVDDVYCVGEPTGIGGLELSIVEGTIAGLSISGATDVRPFDRRRDRLRRVADSMNRCYTLRDELRTLADPETIVCRCEDATYGEMSRHLNFRDAKLQTRCGMGACRGRICGAASSFIFGWKSDSVRPPIFPVRTESLAAEFDETEL